MAEIDWNDLRTALAVARAGSLAGAARALGLDETTMGRRLTRLEAALGRPLFLRSRRGFEPTEAGRAAILEAQAVAARLDRLAEALAGGGEDGAGVVRLVGNDWVLLRLADKALAGFLAAQPRIDVRMLSGAPKGIAPRDASLALWFEAPARDPEFAVPLGPVGYAVYAAAGAPAPADWVAYYDEDMPRLAQARWTERMREAGGRIRFAASDMAMQLAAIRAGVGKGLLPIRLAAEEPGLARLGEGPPELERTLHMHVHPDSSQAPRVARTMAWLRDAWRLWFAGEGASPAPRAVS